MGDSPFFDGFECLELPLTFDEFHRLLPRNPAFKFEYFGSRAVLTPRPYTRSAVLSLPSWRPVPLRRPPIVRTLKKNDWETLPKLFAGAFMMELPFHLLSDEKADALARDCLQFTQQGGDGQVVPDACLLAEEEGQPVGAALVTLSDARRLVHFSAYETPLPKGPLPHLTWIFVSRLMARLGVGRALLAGAIECLKNRGDSVLTSTFLVGSSVSTLWHWQMGFQLLPSGFSVAHQSFEDQNQES